VWATTRKTIGVVGNFTKNTHKLKLEHFPMLLPTVWKNYRHCRQQRETIFCIVGTNEDKCSALWDNAEQNNSLSLPLKGQFTLINVYLDGVQLPVTI
jgi:hypothetical protein